MLNLISWMKGYRHNHAWIITASLFLDCRAEWKKEYPEWTHPGLAWISFPFQFNFVFSDPSSWGLGCIQHLCNGVTPPAACASARVPAWDCVFVCNWSNIWRSPPGPGPTVQEFAPFCTNKEVSAQKNTYPLLRGRPQTWAEVHLLSSVFFSCFLLLLTLWFGSCSTVCTLICHEVPRWSMLVPFSGQSGQHFWPFGQ